MLAALLLATILAHGGARRERRPGPRHRERMVAAPIAWVAAIAVLAALVLPLVFFVLNGNRPLDTAGGSFAMALSSILVALVTRTAFQLDETLLLGGGVGYRHGTFRRRAIARGPSGSGNRKRSVRGRSSVRRRRSFPMRRRPSKPGSLVIEIDSLPPRRSILQGR